MFLIQHVGNSVHSVIAEGAAQDDLEKPIVHAAREPGEIWVIRKTVTVADQANAFHARAMNSATGPWCEQ